MEKSVYVCGSLTELPTNQQAKVKSFYSQIGSVAEQVTGVPAFVPHEHFDPVAHPSFQPAEVDAAERNQVCNCTSCLVVVAIAPSWGGGIEVEMARVSGVPVIILCEARKLDKGKISRLLRGNPAVKAILPYSSQSAALSLLAHELRSQMFKLVLKVQPAAVLGQTQ